MKKSPEVLSYEGAPALPESFPFASAFAHSSFNTTETLGWCWSDEVRGSGSAWQLSASWYPCSSSHWAHRVLLISVSCVEYCDVSELEFCTGLTAGMACSAAIRDAVGMINRSISTGEVANSPLLTVLYSALSRQHPCTKANYRHRMTKCGVMNPPRTHACARVCVAVIAQIGTGTIAKLILALSCSLCRSGS